MSTLFLDPPSKRKEDERYISVESPQQLATWFEENPACVEWCRKDEENREALLEMVRAVTGEEHGVANGLERMFREGGAISAEEFARAVCSALSGGPEVGEGIAEEWQKKREIKELAARLLEEERLARTPGRSMTLTLPGGAEMEMVWCPPGSFTMGSPENEEGRRADERQHRVTLTKGFWLGKYPVTQAQWKSVMGSNPSRFRGDELPVECVSWYDAQEFCRQTGNGLRLPTEAQWEYACRAGSKTAYFWGHALNGDKANCDGNYPCGTISKGPYERKTTPVGSYSPNAWGFHDMHGNVLEWCADWKGSYPIGPVTDPKGPAMGTNVVVRGGSWFNYARSCRSAYRNSCARGFKLSFYGFRPCLVTESGGSEAISEVWQQEQKTKAAEEGSRRQDEEPVRREREMEEKAKCALERIIAEADENMALMDAHLGAL